MARVLGAFFNAVIQEVGMEKALALLSKCMEDMGSRVGKMTKEQMGIKELDTKTIISLMKGLCEDYGFVSVFEESPTTVLVKQTKCPFYGGFQEAGLNHEAIEAFCRNGPAVNVKAWIEQLDPNVDYQLKKFLSSPDDFCVEEFVLKK